MGLVLSIDPRSGEVRRYHAYPTSFQGTFKLAVARAGIVKHATVHTLRHYSAFRTIAECPTSRSGIAGKTAPRRAGTRWRLGIVS